MQLKTGCTAGIDELTINYTESLDHLFHCLPAAIVIICVYFSNKKQRAYYTIYSSIICYDMLFSEPD